MLKVLKNYEDRGREAHSPHFSMAICEIGGGYCRSNAYREWARKFLVVAVDYFTKWAEAEALAAITTTNITSFLWKSVVCRTTRKGHRKDTKGRNPSVGGFRRDKVKDIQKRIRPNPFLRQPERVMERIQREETPRLGVSEKIRLRISRKESTRILSSDNPKGSWK
jgi:hypothetical protein